MAQVSFRLDIVKLSGDKIVTEASFDDRNVRWYKMDIRKPVDAIADSFEVEANVRVEGDIQNIRELLAVEKLCMIRTKHRTGLNDGEDGWIAYVVGFIDAVNFRMDAGSFRFSVIGRSVSAQLVDITYTGLRKLGKITYPQLIDRVIKNAGLDSLFKALTNADSSLSLDYADSYNNQDVFFYKDWGKAVRLSAPKIDYDAKCFSIIDAYGSRANRLLYSNRDGILVAAPFGLEGRDVVTEKLFHLEYGVNILEFKYLDDSTSRYYKYVGRYSKDKKKKNYRTTYDNDVQRKFRVMRTNLSGTMSSVEAYNRIGRIKEHRRANSQSLQVTVTSLLKSRDLRGDKIIKKDGYAPIGKNELTVVSIPHLGIKNEILITSDVHYTYDREKGERVVLTLKDRYAYQVIK